MCLYIITAHKANYVFMWIHILYLWVTKPCRFLHGYVSKHIYYYHPMSTTTQYLEAQLGEEPSVLSALELLLKERLCLLICLLTLSAVLHNIGSNHILQVYFKGITSWHHVLVVHQFGECLQAGAARLLLLRRLLNHLHIHEYPISLTSFFNHALCIQQQINGR